MRIIYKSQLHPKEGEALTIKNLITNLRALMFIQMPLINIGNPKLRKIYHLMKKRAVILLDHFSKMVIKIRLINQICYTGTHSWVIQYSGGHKWAQPVNQEDCSRKPRSIEEAAQEIWKINQLMSRYKDKELNLLKKSFIMVLMIIRKLNYPI